jgi:mannose/fructose/N-acetylgalactosamine-specific phosphotransferase system component IID
MVNRCWWDTKPCQYYSEIKGFQEARDLCNGCWRVDRERFISILEETIPDITQCFRDEEKAAKEAIKEETEAEVEETWQEIHEEILGVIAEFEEEN